MGWVSAIGGAVKGFFGLAASPGADKVFEAAKGIGNWVDEQQYTDQEKANMRAQLFSQWQDWFGKTATENTEQSISRRNIAIFVIRTEFCFLLASGVFFRIDPEWAKYWWDIAVKSPWGDLTLGVGAFFFAVHLVRNWQQNRPPKE